MKTSDVMDVLITVCIVWSLIIITVLTGDHLGRQRLLVTINICEKLVHYNKVDFMECVKNDR